MTDDRNVVARSAAQSTTIACLLFYVGDHGSFGHGAEGQDVADGQRCVLAGVNELPSIHALVGNERFGAELVTVWIPEGDPRERGTSAGIVDDFLYDTANVSMPFSKIESSELRGCLVQACVGRWSVL